MTAFPAPQLLPTDHRHFPDAVALDPDDATGSDDTEVWELFALPGAPVETASAVVRNVTRPTLLPFLPDPAVATGAAAIVVPGGAYKMVGVEHEGTAVARRLVERGIAAFVLKYRTHETPVASSGALQEILAVLAGAGGQPDGGLSAPRAVHDAVRALDLVRERAPEWGLDPQQVGILGFSAGAITVKRAVLDAGARPAFLGYVYGSMLAEEVPADAPPLFAALALDDRLFGADGFGLVESWRRSGAPVELHAYERGNHGFGTGAAGTTSTGVIDQFVDWLATGRRPAGRP